MRKLLLAGLLVLFMSSAAIAIPFQITESELDLTWESGNGLVYYTSNSMDTSVNLEAGQSFDYTFGKIFFPAAFGSGEAKFTLTLDTPDPLGVVSDVGTFEVFSLFFFSDGDLLFGDPVDFGYSYNGADGGLFSLNIDSLSGFQLGSWVDLTGTITNKATPVPEPGTLLLFGTGLAGLALYRRRSMNK